MAKKRQRKKLGSRRVVKPGTSVNVVTRPVAEADTGKSYAQGVDLTLEQFGQHVGKLAASLHHSGCNVPPYVLLVGDKFYAGLSASSTMRRRIDRIRILSAALNQEVAQVMREGEPVELLALDGAPPDVRSLYGDLAPRLGDPGQ